MDPTHEDDDVQVKEQDIAETGKPLLAAKHGMCNNEGSVDFNFDNQALFYDICLTQVNWLKATKTLYCGIFTQSTCKHMLLGCGPSGFHFLPSYQFGRPLPSEDQPFELSELCLNKTSSSEDSYSKTYKDESKSSTLMFNMTFLSDMEVDTKKKDESQPSRILASCRTSVDRVCSMEFLKERLLQHPTSSNLLYLLSLSLIHHHH